MQRCEDELRVLAAELTLRLARTLSPRVGFVLIVWEQGPDQSPARILSNAAPLDIRAAAHAAANMVSRSDGSPEPVAVPGRMLH